MKFIRKIALLAILGTTASCAMMFNEKTVDVSISSNPAGADIFIEGRNYGKTPATINIEPKDYKVILTKEGYGSTQLDLEYWVTIRNGKCMADVLGAMLVVPYYSFYWSGYCNDFKKKDYFVTIPRLGNTASGAMGGSSMMGVGNNPQDMINYYYGQDMMKNGGDMSQFGGQQNGGYQQQGYQQQGYQQGYQQQGGGYPQGGFQDGRARY